jgi:predicted nucleic acid-binding protein
VQYECLYKKREKDRDKQLINKLNREIVKSKFNVCSITIDDLQEMEVLENRKRLGKGELSSIVFAKKTNQAFLTDDRKARSLGKSVLGNSKVQTTPHLVGFCFYKRYLLDGDFNSLIVEHKASLKNQWGDLSDFFKEVYEESLRIRLMERRV